jgi:hypothetical protein
MTDTFSSYSAVPNSPARYAAAITPSNTNLLPVYARGIYVGGSGNIALTTPNGDTVTFIGVLAGTILPVCVSQVFATNTTATNLIALS